MKTHKYLLFPIIFFLTSCYIYKPYSEKDIADMAKPGDSMPSAKSLLNDDSSVKATTKSKKEQGIQNMSPEEAETQLKKEKEKEEESQKGQMSFSRSDGSGETTKAASKGKEMKSEEPKSKETGIKGRLQPNKYYKITALGNQYKIQVDKWEGDTLVSHKIRKPNKQFKFHKDDIEEEAILERRFSKPFSDLLTVGAYASGAAIVLLLIL